MSRLEDMGLDPEKMKGLIDAGFSAPDIMGTQPGWRAWNVDRKVPRFNTAPKLWSATFGYYWTPRVKAAADCHSCTDPDPESEKHVPGESCSCGFYSAKSLKHLRRMGYHSYNEYGDHGHISVVGQVANWGKVIEGSQGWRAEFSYPVVLFVPFEAWRLALPIQKAYGVPVKLLNLLDDTKVPEEAKSLDTNEGLE